MTSPTAANRVVLQAVLILTVMIATTGVVSAQAVGPEIPIWVDTVDSFRPSVAFNPNHEEFLVVWFNQQGPSTVDVYARRVNMDGSLDTWFSVVSSPGGNDRRPDLAFNQIRDEYLVVWEHEVVVGDFDVHGARVVWNGSLIGAPFIIRSVPDFQLVPDVVFNPNDDEYLVVYANQWAGGTLDVDAQRVGGDGSLLSWANVASDSVTERFFPRVAFSPELGRYIIAYMHKNLSTTRIAAACKTAPSDLAGLSTDWEYGIAVDPVDDAYNPAVAASHDGFLSVLQFPWNIVARRIAPDGNPQGPETGYPVGYQNALGVGWPERAAGVARADAVGAVAAWHVHEGVERNVYAQALSPQVDGVLSDVFTVADSAADETEVDIDCTPSGICLVVYQKDFDVVGRIIRLNLFGDGFEVGDTRNWSGVVP